MNINHLASKISDLKKDCRKSPLDILFLDENKFDSFFPDSQLKTDGFQYLPFRRDQNRCGGGKTVIKEGIFIKTIGLWN